jgi:hypothetical protein
MSANCPGFKPHGVKPTRCRKCFKEYSEHVKQDEQINNRKSLTRSYSDETKAQTPEDISKLFSISKFFYNSILVLNSLLI